MILLPTLFLAAFSAIAQEEPPAAVVVDPGHDPAAVVWLDKMATISGKPVRYNMRMTMNMEAMDMNMASEMEIYMLDNLHMVSTGLTVVEGELMPNGRQEIHMKTVLDGKNIWIEVLTPMPEELGGGEMTQVMKIGLDQMDKLGEMAGLGSQFGGIMDLTDMDIASRMREMFDLYYRDISVVETKNSVVMEGRISEELMDLPGMEMLELEEFRIELDAETAFPTSMVMGVDGSETMKIVMSNVSFPDPKKIDKKDFVYTPPDDATVIDLGAMLGAAAEDEDEAEF